MIPATIDANGLRHWREDELAALPVKNGVRMRGMEMTRLETFADAAFAFAVTLLVISVDELPDSYETFTEALKGTPAFLASFAQLTMFWLGHRAWSRTYGMEDIASVWMTMALIGGVLVIVYPLRVIFSSAAAYLTDGWAPGNFEVTLANMTYIFTVYGTIFCVLCGLICLLHLHAWRKREALRLSALEALDARSDVEAWGFLAGFGLLAAVIAQVAGDSRWVVLSGWVYALLGVLMPVMVALQNRRRARVSG